MKRVVGILAVLAVGLAALIGWQIKRQDRLGQGAPSGSGVVELAGVDLSALTAARVLAVKVHEGQAVAKDTVLLTLDCQRNRAHLAEVQAQWLRAQAQLREAQARAQAAAAQSAAAVATVRQAGAQARALVARQALAERDAARYTAMGEHAALSIRDRATATASELQAEQRAAQALTHVHEDQALAAQAQQVAADEGVAAAQQALQALVAQRSRAQLDVDECQVRTPQAGRVERVYFDPGEWVPVSATVARLVDPRLARITFYVSNADMGQVQVGLPATVLADAYPEQPYQGYVRRVGLEAEFTPRNIQTRSDRDRLVYPVEVEVKDGEPGLRDGLPAQVTLGPAQ